MKANNVSCLLVGNKCHGGLTIQSMLPFRFRVLRYLRPSRLILGRRGLSHCLPRQQGQSLPFVGLPLLSTHSNDVSVS